MGSPDTTPTIGVQWPLKYVWAAVKQHPLLVSIALGLPVVDHFLPSGPLPELSMCVAAAFVLSTLCITAMRLAAMDNGEQLDVASPRGAWRRMVVISLIGSMFVASLQIGMMSAWIASVALHAKQSATSPPPSYPSVLKIEPAIVAKHALSKGAIVGSSDVCIQDMTVTRFLGSRDKYVVHKPKNVVGHILLDPVAEGEAISPFSVGASAEQMRRLSSSTHKPGRVVFVRKAISQHEMIDDESIELRPVAEVTGGTFTSANDLVGMVALRDLHPGEKVTIVDAKAPATNDTEDAIPKTFDRSLEHQYFLAPKTKEPLRYAAYRLRAVASRPIRQGEVFSGANTYPVYVPVALGPGDIPLESTPFSRELSSVYGFTAKKDLTEGSEIGEEAIGPFSEGNRLGPAVTPVGFYFIRLSTLIPLLSQILLPITGGIVFSGVWFYVYSRLCLASVPIALSGAGLLSAVKISWSSTHGRVKSSARYLARFGVLYWLVPVVAAVVATLVRFTSYMLPGGEIVSVVLSIFGAAVSLVSSIVFSVIMVPLYLNWKTSTSEESQTSARPQRQRERGVKMLGCGSDHASPLLGGAALSESDDGSAVASDDGVVIDVRRAVTEKEQLP